MELLPLDVREDGLARWRAGESLDARNVCACATPDHGTATSTSAPAHRTRDAPARMTNSPPHDDPDQDQARGRAVLPMHAHRRRVGWAAMIFAIAALLAADAWLYLRYRRYVRETAELRASMTDVERKRTDALLAQEENRLKVMVELFKRQAKLDPSLHLSVSLDSGVMYLERDGALLREMPITVGPEKRVGTPPDTLHIAAPRGKRTVERLLGETDPWPLPAWVYQDRGVAPEPTATAGALGPAALALDGGTLIYSLPSVGPLNDSTYVLPGAIRVRASDLKAIAPNLHAGVAVYFY